MTYNREQLMDELRKRDCRVIFRKVNGEERDMICTLREDIVPKPQKDDPITQKKVREITPEVIAVWDVKAEGWRSFRIENIISFS